MYAVLATFTLLLWAYAPATTAFADNNNVSYNILAIFPFNGMTHFNTFQPLLLELSRRGHNLTVYSTFPRKVPMPNYNDVDISDCRIVGYDIDWSVERISPMSAFEYLSKLFQMSGTVGRISTCEPLLRLRDNGEQRKYHLLITQFWITDWVLGYAYKFRIPFVGICSSALMPWLLPRIGQPENLGCKRYGHSLRSADLSRAGILDRIRNVYYYLVSLWLYKYYTTTLYDPITRALFDDNNRSFPSVEEIAANTSLLLINSHFSTAPTVVPMVPAAVHIGGIIDKASPLPLNIEEFINKFENGIVYFSMGSVLKSTSFPVGKRDAFITAFSKLPLSMGVIWKLELPELQMNLSNLLISKWLPQRDILAHPKVRLFISHGGQSSINEAIHEGVPVLGIPLFIDQIDNVNLLVKSGAAEMMAYTDITTENVLMKINLIIQNDSYKANAKKLSSIYKDRPMSPLDTAVYWTEYVLRHKGAHHLRTPAVRMTWYQYYLVDVLATISVLVLTFISIVYISLKILVCKLHLCTKTRYLKLKTN